MSGDWIAVAGILGTLGGLIVGAFTTYKIQEWQSRHADATKFQDLRMKAYIQFIDFTNGVRNQRRAGGLNSTGILVKFSACSDQIQLIGTDAVVAEVMAVHNLIFDVKSKEDANAEEKLDAATARFRVAARAELRVDKA